MQARLRAQLGDRSEYSGERRRRSVVVASIVLTITDPLRGSYPLLCNLQAALIRSFGASFACMELTIISRFQRLQTSRKYSLHSLFYSFSVLSKYRVPTMQNRSGDWCKQQCINALKTFQKNRPFGMIQFAFKFEKKSFYHQGRCCGFYRRGVHDNECVSQHKT